MHTQWSQALIYVLYIYIHSINKNYNIATIVSGHPIYLSRLCHLSCFPRRVAHHSSLQLQLAKSNDVMWLSILGHWRPCIPFDSHRNHRISHWGRSRPLMLPCSWGYAAHTSKSIVFQCLLCILHLAGSTKLRMESRWTCPKIDQNCLLLRKACHFFPAICSNHGPGLPLFNISESQSARPVSHHILASVIKVCPAIDMGHSNQGKKRTKQHTYLQSEEQLKVSWTEP